MDLGKFKVEWRYRGDCFLNCNLFGHLTVILICDLGSEGIANASSPVVQRSPEHVSMRLALNCADMTQKSAMNKCLLHLLSKELCTYPYDRLIGIDVSTMPSIRIHLSSVLSPSNSIPAHFRTKLFPPSAPMRYLLLQN